MCTSVDIFCELLLVLKILFEVWYFSMKLLFNNNNLLLLNNIILHHYNLMIRICHEKLLV